MALSVATVFFILFATSVVFCRDVDGIFDLYATTPAWHMGKTMHTVNATEYLKPFHNVYDRPMCREEKCMPQDCQYSMSLTYDPDIELQLNCSCHISCYTSGRCCLNFEEVCLSGQRSQWVADTFPHEESLIELSGLQDQKNTMTEDEYYKKLTTLRTKMVTVAEIRESEDIYRMVNKCPACGPNSTCQNIKDLCEKRVLIDAIQFVPVVIDTHLYQNRFCALCSGDDIRSMGYISNKFDVSCTTGREELVQFYETGDHENILQAIKLGQCNIKTSFEQPDAFNLKPIYKIARKCDPRYKLLVENYDEIDEACRSYSAVLAYKRGPKGYGLQNEHCGLCNLHPDEEDRDPWCLCNFDGDDFGRSCVYIDSLRGDISAELFIPFFQIALDFKGTAQVKRSAFDKCKGTEYLDVLQNQCIRSDCTKDMYKYQNRCLSQDRFHFDILPPLTQLMNNRNTGICMSLEADPSNFIGLIRFINSELNSSKRTFRGSDSYVFNSMGCSPIQGLQVPGFINSTSIFYELELPEYKDISVLKYFIEEGPALMSELEKTYPVKQALVQFEAVSPCPSTHLQRVFGDFSIVWDDEGWLSFRYANERLYSNGKVYFPEMDMALNLSFVSVVVSLSRRDAEWRVSKSALVCFQVNDSCPTEYALSGDCSLPLMKTMQTSPTVRFTWDAILTLIFACISCVTLILILILHILIPGIMKSGGRAFVQLILSLLLAECCIMCGMFIPKDGIMCSGFAVVQHFSWLCTFAWTALLSLDIFKVFVLNKNATLEGNKLHFMYPVLGWGLPVVIVGCCIGLHSVGYFQYGGHGSCWISVPIQLGLSFGLPVAAIILFNATLYIMVVVTLRRKMEASAAVGRDYSWKMRFVLYCKMSTVVGFTWIFGFLANVEALSFMSYVFSISAGLNGLVLSISFTFSPTSIMTIKQKWIDFTGTVNRNSLDL